MNIVLNASPIISLINLQIINVCLGVFDDIIIPSGVKEEILREKDDASIWIMSEAGNFIQQTDTINDLVKAWDLGKGETEVISMTLKSKGYIAGLDDKAARKCAASLNISVMGTIGILIQAKKHNKLDKIEPKLMELKTMGFRIDEQIIQQALHLVNE